MEYEGRFRTLEERVDQFFEGCTVGDPKLIALNHVVQLADAQNQYDMAWGNTDFQNMDANEIQVQLTDIRQSEARLAMLDVLHQDRLVSMPGYKKATNQISEFNSDQFKRAGGSMQTDDANKFWSTRLETILEKVE
jgi:hypothetical protein